MGGEFAGFEKVATIELTRRRTFEKTAAAYAVSRDEGIVRQAREYVAKYSKSDDPIRVGTVDGYRDFLAKVC